MTFSVTAFLAGGSVTLAALLLGWAVQHSRPISVRARRTIRELAAQEAAQVQTLSPGERAAAMLDGFYAAIGMRSAADRRLLGERLAQAGINSPEAVTLFQAALLVAPTLGAFAGYHFAPVIVAGAEGVVRIAIAAFGLALGAVSPRLLLGNRIKKRQAALSRSLPDALDLYVICAEAGLGMDAAMARVAREFRLAAPELAEEMRLTAIELGFLPVRQDAFANLLKRVPLPAFRGLVAMFQQTERYGTPLADALRVLASEYRARAMMKAEAKAAQLPAILTVPMIIFVLPPLFIVLVGPAILQVLAAG